MGFVQIIKLTTTRLDEVEAAHERWLAETEGQRTVLRELVCRDREHPEDLYVIVEFPSYAEAMRNNDLAATARIAERLQELGDDMRFFNLDLIRADGRQFVGTGAARSTTT